MSQLGFDLEALIAEADRDAMPVWDGAPLGYHEEFFTYAEHMEACERRKLDHGTRPGPFSDGMWHECMWHTLAPMNGHVVGVLMSGGALKYQALCDTCRWHLIDNEECAISEAINDHAWPGWRELPVMPGGLSEQSVAAWCEANYPPEWRAPGAPIRTFRAMHGTRHVPGRSPYGGYDMAVVN